MRKQAVLEVKALQALREMIGEDVADSVLVEVLDSYLEDTPKQLQALRTASETGNTAALGMVAHTLKSTSATLGASTLSQLCNDMEAMVGAGDITEALALKVQQLLIEYEQVEIALQAERTLYQS